MKRLLLSTLLLLSSPVIAQWRDIKISSTTDVGAIQENFRRASLWSNRKMDKFGNDTIYGQPIFKNGVKFGDGTIQNTAGDVVLAATQTFTGSNSFTATGAGGTSISSATIANEVVTASTITKLNVGTFYGAPVVFGEWVVMTATTTWLAASDGILTVAGSPSSAGTIGIMTDAGNPASVLRNYVTGVTVGNAYSAISPVKKGHYWKIYKDGGMAVSAVYWLPIGN